MARWKATVPAYVDGVLRGVDEEFPSDAVPGSTWRPIDKEAKAAVREHEAAKKAAAKVEPVAGEDPRVAQLEGLAAEQAAEINRLQGEVEALTAPPAETPADEPK